MIALGCRVKTARATLIVLGGSASGPRVLERRSLTLSDPRLPDSQQPYHAALGLSEREAAAVERRTSRAVKAQTLRVFSAVRDELAGAGHRLAGMGIVVGSLKDATSFANPHIRAHAMEGRLFREAVEEAADACRLKRVTLVERNLYEDAAGRWKRPTEAIRRDVQELGQSAGRPWRAEEKSAALAAWLILAT